MSRGNDGLIGPEELTRVVESRAENWRSAGDRVDAAALELELRKNVTGEVRFDAGTKAMYATDASNYRQMPIGVVIPRSKEDVVQTVAAARKFGAPVLSRGGGTSLAGQCCNVAVVIDWSKYMHGVLEINTAERWARVLPGTVCDELRDAALEASGRRLTWGPDPATHTHCSFGGMIGNNSCGAHAQMSGKTDNNIEELEVLLYDGTRMTVGWMTDADWESQIAQGGREGEIYRHLRSLRDHYADLVRKNYPADPSPRLRLQPRPPDSRRTTAASTLPALWSEAKARWSRARSEMHADRRQSRARALMLGYPDVYEAADHVIDINHFKPTALEGMDYRLYEHVEKKGGPQPRIYARCFPKATAG